MKEKEDYKFKERTNNVSVFARRTESLDAPGIQKLITKKTYEVFGRVNVAYVM